MTANQLSTRVEKTERRFQVSGIILVLIIAFLGIAPSLMAQDAPHLVITTTGDKTSICQGASIELCATDGFDSYLWSNGATTRCITVNKSGNYSVTAMLGGESFSCSKEITVLPIPDCDISGKLSFCPGGSTELCAPEGFASYVWFPLAVGRCITVTAPGTYSVKVTDANGCFATHYEEVKVNTPPSFEITCPPSFCIGGSAQLCVPAGFASYLWSNGATTNCITVTEAGDYTVTVTDENGCSTTKSKSISVSQKPPCDITATPTSITGQLQLCAPAGLSYVWSNGSTSQCIIVNGGGTWSVTTTNAAGCSSTCSKTINTCTGFRTQTMGGWGAPPNGNNPGTYMHANFAATFPGPDYLTIGCATGKLRLTSAQAVTNFLPSGSTARALPAGTLLNPTRASYNNVLAGQLVAATLAVKFDEKFANFSPSTTLLKDLVINAGPFQGWTIAQLLAEANKAIGGCGSSFKFSDINDALNAFNNNYDNGTKNQGFTRCPALARGMMSTPTAELKGTGSLLATSYPNPAVSAATIKFRNTDKASHATVAIYTLDGRKVATLFDKDVTAGVTYEASLNTRTIGNGVYLYKITNGNETLVRKLVVAK